MARGAPPASGAGRAYQPSIAVGASVALLVLAALAAVLVIRFDSATSLPFNDEPWYRWSAGQLASGRGLRPYPGVWALDLVQIIAAAVPLVLHLPVVAVRLTVLPFLAAQGYFTYRVARLLDASGTWAVLAAVALACSPLELAVATGLMTDVAYLAALMVFCYFACRWLLGSEGATACIVSAAVACLQRQHAAVLPLALTAGLLLTRPPSRWSRRDRIGLAVLWLAVGAAAGTPFLTGLAPRATTHFGLYTSPYQMVANVFGIVLNGPVLLGLVALPFLPAIAVHGGPASGSRWSLVPLAVGWAAAVGGIGFVLMFGVSIFPGDYFGPGGLGPLHLDGAKPTLIPTWAFRCLEAIVILNFVLLLIRHRHRWNRSQLGDTGTFLLVVGLSQLPLMFLTGATDRYFLAVVAPILPVLAARFTAAGRATAALASAVGLVAVSVGYYALGQQDYVSWQIARDQAAGQAYDRAARAGLGPEAVSAGYEEDIVHALIPAYERTGTAPWYFPPGFPNPRFKLVFASPGDPRPGFNYESVSPGKIVIEDLGKP